jgi:hypothetical protein
MARNDLLLLDSIVEKARLQLNDDWDDAESFELNRTGIVGDLTS